MKETLFKWLKIIVHDIMYVSVVYVCNYYCNNVIKVNSIRSFYNLWHCEYLADIDDCVGVTCSGHGNCLNGVGSHTCSCEFGYTGSNCEMGIFLMSLRSM